MIHIKYPDGRRPPRKWLKRADALTMKLKAARSKDERDEIIDRNSHLWGEIKEWLESFSGRKCWFSEARDSYSHWQVEHFRPKKEARDPDRDGYWWRAFDYLNYRLCGGVGNAKKGSYFPLREGTHPATCPEDDCGNEAPTLIDPTVEADVMLLTFSYGGLAEAAERHGWHRKRAKISIDRYKLNTHAALRFARAEIWNSCKSDVEQLEIFMAEQDRNDSSHRRTKIDEIAKRLKDRTRPDAQFSSVARAFLTQHPKQRVRELVD